MRSPSLGESLALLEAGTGSEGASELHRLATVKGPCAVEDFTLVELFFRDAALAFATAIAADILPRPVVIGRGCHERVATTLQTFRWKGGFDIRSPEHPYHAVWSDFAAWCRRHGLEATLEGAQSAKEAMFYVSVRPL
ncbi:hypothetical protein HDE77_001884 [Rhodanobacter sp. MP7CTX1]|nr:hypothetical protein [Rhodanobacter sp. MP7CTX1]